MKSCKTSEPIKLASEFYQETVEKLKVYCKHAPPTKNKFCDFRLVITSSDCRNYSYK